MHWTQDSLEKHVSLLLIVSIDFLYKLELPVLHPHACFPLSHIYKTTQHRELDPMIVSAIFPGIPLGTGEKSSIYLSLYSQNFINETIRKINILMYCVLNDFSAEVF